MSQGAQDGIGRVGPDATAERLPDEGGQTDGWPLVDSNKNITCANAGTLSWGVRRYTFGPKATGSLYPPNTVGGDIKATLSLEVHHGEHAPGQRRQSERDGQNTRLGSVVHILLRCISTSNAKRGYNHNA